MGFAVIHAKYFGDSICKISFNWILPRKYLMLKNVYKYININNISLLKFYISL